MGDNKVDNKGFYDDFEAKNIDKDYLDEMYRKAHTRSFTIDEFLEYQRKLNEPEPEFDMKRLGRIVALLAIVIISSIGFTIYTMNQGANADKNKENKLIVNQTENDRSVSGKDVNVDDGTVIEETILRNWDDVLIQKEKYPSFILPSGIPNDFVFSFCKLENYDAKERIFYLSYFSDKRGELLITQYDNVKKESTTSTLSNNTEIVEVEGHKIFVTKAEVENSLIAVFYFKDTKFILSGTIDLDETIKIAKNILLS